MINLGEAFDRVSMSGRDLRRRFTAGLLFLLVLLVGVFWFPEYPDLKNEIRNALSFEELTKFTIESIGGMAILFSFVFVLGTLIEVFSLIFLSRIFYVTGSTAIYRWVSSLFGKLAGTSGLSGEADKEVRGILSSLPHSIQEGLNNPYSRRYEIAFRYLIHLAPEDEKAWLYEIQARNRNLYNILSSISFAVLLVILLSLQFSTPLSFLIAELPARSGICERQLVKQMVDADVLEMVDSDVLVGETIEVDFIRDLENRESTAIEFVQDRIDKAEPMTRYGLEKRFKSCFPDGSSLDVAIAGSLAVLLFMFVLAFSYSAMLRSSTLDVLEMLSLRSNSPKPKDSSENVKTESNMKEITTE